MTYDALCIYCKSINVKFYLYLFKCYINVHFLTQFDKKWPKNRVTLPHAQIQHSSLVMKYDGLPNLIFKLLKYLYFLIHFTSNFQHNVSFHIQVLNDFLWHTFPFLSFLFSFTFCIRRKYWNRESSRLPLFNEFARFGRSWTRVLYFYKMSVCLPVTQNL